MASLVVEEPRVKREAIGGMADTPRERNGLNYQVQDHERRLRQMEQLPVTEMKVDLAYLKNEVAAIRAELREQSAALRAEVKEDYGKVNSTVTWILRTLVAACLTLLMGVLIWVLNGGPPQ